MKIKSRLIVSIGILLSLQTLAAPSKECEMSADGIMASYNAILDQKNSEKSLQCLLTIHREASGILKSLAAAALRPLMGGMPLAGRKLNSQNKKTTEALIKKALDQDTLLQDYATGTWGFYDLFCKEKTSEYCTLFLPDESQVLRESALIGSSSMLLLRTAYLHLQGSEKMIVEERLRQLYQRISSRDTLKRKTIDNIYQELFGIHIPLSRLS
jgi:hypothetical protein